MSKKISQRDILGERGVAFVREIILGMGFMFYETGGVEAGIDGTIEIRDQKTEEATNIILQVQVKSTSQNWEKESDASFIYRCSEKDLKYWLNGNAPVLLILSRPQTKEAYWISIKDYFHSSKLISERKIIIDKNQNSLSGSEEAIKNIGIPKNSGVYFNPPRVKENLISNLLKVNNFPKYIHSADTSYNKGAELWAETQNLGIKLPGEWIIWQGRIWSFHDVSEKPFAQFCDVGTYQKDNSSEWAYSLGFDKRNRFSWLLRECLKNKLHKLNVYFDRKEDHFYFGYLDLKKSRQINYRKGSRKSPPITVFQAYPNFVKTYYYRHTAFIHKFKLYSNNWYLEITPTYRYTYNGKNLARKRNEYLSKIKKIEKNKSVLSLVELWASILTRKNGLDREKELLEFGELLKFEINVGLSKAKITSNKSKIDNNTLDLFSNEN